MAAFDKKTLDDWRTLAAKDLKGGDPEGLAWQTPEVENGDSIIARIEPSSNSPERWPHENRSRLSQNPCAVHCVTSIAGPNGVAHLYER